MPSPDRSQLGRIFGAPVAGQDDMSDIEAKQRAGEHVAAALHNLGWEQGAGATIWARAITDELARLEDARARFETDTADLEAWERLHSSALLLVVSIDQVLVFEYRVRCLTGDAELQKARAAFEARGPDVAALRDIVMHLDAYAVGEGHRQTGETLPRIAEKYVSQFIWYTPGGDVRVDLGDEQVSLGAAARAAIELAQVVERVRAKYLQRAEEEANAALRERYGLPDPE
jgi:hypothetical protein